MSLWFLLSCGLQKPDAQENLSRRSITIWAIDICVSPKDIKRGVLSEEHVSFEQKRSGISAQADGILDRRLLRWLWRFPNGRHSPKPLVGTSVQIRQTTLRENWTCGRALSNPPL
jgi:hypothetical protein